MKNSNKFTADIIKSGKMESNDLIWDLDNGIFTSKTETGNKMVEAIASAFLERKITKKDFANK